MAGEMEMKKFVNEKVKPFMNKGLPEILHRLGAVENVSIQCHCVLFPPDMEPRNMAMGTDPGLDAWAQKTYGG